MPDSSITHIFDFLPDGTVSVSKDQRIVHVNRAAAEMFGYPLEELIDQPLEILLPPEQRERHRGHVQHFIATGTRGRYMGERSEIIGYRRDGTRFPAEASIVRSAVHQPAVVTAFIRDITERKQRDAALAASEERHRAMLETCPDAILIGDPETGLITEANEEAGRLFGCPANDLVGLHQSELHPPETRERFRRTFREHVEIGRVFVHDAVIQQVNGRVVPVEIAARPRVIGGRPVLIGFFRNISRQKEREQELQRARINAEAANRAKTMFLANMNHELRTPLNGIIGLAEMMQAQLYGPLGHAKYVEYSGDIAQTGKHLLGVIHGILEISAMELGKHRMVEESLGVATLVAECQRLVLAATRAAGIDLRNTVDPGLRLSADRQLLRQMLINLLSNAVKHTPKDGRIGISATTDRDGWLAISVADSGSGIRPEMLSRVAEPFGAVEDAYTRKKGGVGLGLAITKAFVERHGGRLEIESEPGRGTCVSLVFPPERVIGAGESAKLAASPAVSDLHGSL